MKCGYPDRRNPHTCNEDRGVGSVPDDELEEHEACCQQDHRPQPGLAPARTVHGLDREIEVS